MDPASNTVQQGSQKWNGEIVILFNNVERTLRPSIRAIMEIERLSGIGIVPMSDNFKTGNLRLTDIVCIVTGCLNTAGQLSDTTGKPYTVLEVGDIIYKANEMAAFIEISTALLLHMISGGEHGKAVLGKEKRAIKAGIVLKVDRQPVEEAYPKSEEESNPT
jgi:hypothetical protein